MEPLLVQHIRLRGVVQGVGMRPTVWRYATELGLHGDVCNDGEGVLIRVCGSNEQLQQLIAHLQQNPPALARIDAIETSMGDQTPLPPCFQIITSTSSSITTVIAADAATCPACVQEISAPLNRRYRYPFTNCTQCGPRFSIMKGIPYDRGNTSMDNFEQCPLCRAEYEDPANRRYHAQPNACPVCGPQLWLEDNAGQRPNPVGEMDAIALAAHHLKQGKILAIKGIGGFHLACDATNRTAVEQLRLRKKRFAKAFALMARDNNVIARYAKLSSTELELLRAPSAPVVILDALPNAIHPLPDAIAPGQTSLGFMLPYSPLHHLLLQEFDLPLVMTSGNVSDEPQCLSNDIVQQRLNNIADYFLMHDRDILNRGDDSVVRIVHQHPRVLRRGRGMAPHSITLHHQFKSPNKILAMGAELKNAFCLLQQNSAVLSPHMGDLEDATTFQDYQKNLALFQRLYEFDPDLVVVDGHPNYLSTQLGRKLAMEKNIPIVSVLHHHAHIASVMAEAGLEPTAEVLGIALDGLGMGEQGALWGGEILKVSFQYCQRLGGLQPVALPGGAQAMREPWRNTLAYLLQLGTIPQLQHDYGKLDILEYLQHQPLHNLQRMIEKNLNSPQASSAGRLFDAVAAALNIARDRAHYEGQAAVEMEALAAPRMDQEAGSGYPMNEVDNRIDTLITWKCILAELRQQIPADIIAARFHHGFANAVVRLASRLAAEHKLSQIALAGGVFQNRLLLELIASKLERGGFVVHIPQQVPVNDGGIALGQAVVGMMLSAPIIVSA